MNAAIFFSRRRKKQRGVVLFIALIVLVAMTLTAVALIRSVDTANLIAGNLAFQQSAIRSADAGFDAAITWLQNNQGSTVLENDDPTNGYDAAGASTLSNPGQTTAAMWGAYWNQYLASKAYPQGTLTPDQAGNSYRYVIQRMCMQAGPQAGAQCGDSPATVAKAANGEEAGMVQMKGFSVVYYRITVRVDGPKNTVAYVQTVVSM